MAGRKETNPFSEQYVKVMKETWTYIEEHYKPHEIWGEEGEQLVLWHSAMRCHGDFVLGCAFLSLGVAAANGAVTHLFGDDPSPLYLWFLNNNYPQVRKSEVTKLLGQGAKELDKIITDRLHAPWNAKWRDLRNAAAGQHAQISSKPPEPQVVEPKSTKTSTSRNPQIIFLECLPARTVSKDWIGSHQIM